MASITSVISLFVLLLVTYCYSVPIGQKYDFTTDKTMVGRENDMNVELTTNDEPSGAPHMNIKRTSDEHDSDEYTTPSHTEDYNHESHHKRTLKGSPYTKPTYEHDSDEHKTSGHMEKDDDESHHERSVEDFSFTTSAVDSVPEEQHHLRSFDQYLFTTMESSTQFNDRAIRSRERESEEDQRQRAEPENELEMTTVFESSSSVEPESHTFESTSSFQPKSHKFESTSSVEPEWYTSEPTSSFQPKSHTFESTSSIEPESNTYETSSSIDSFGKSTGLLHDDEAEHTSTTSEKFENDRSDEHTSTRFPVNKQRYTQTETIIPGKITETKIFSNAPSRTYIVSEPIPVQKSQLSQGSTLLLFLLAALVFCAFLLATAIAIVKLGHSLKRKIQITEMEADLDKHYQHLGK